MSRSGKPINSSIKALDGDLRDLSLSLEGNLSGQLCYHHLNGRFISLVQMEHERQEIFDDEAQFFVDKELFEYFKYQLEIQY